MRSLKPAVYVLLSVVMLLAMIGMPASTPLKARELSGSQAEQGTVNAAAASDYTFDFNDLTSDQQRDKPFGYGPYWDVDPAWNAHAWGPEDIDVENGALAIAATFTKTGSDADQKGYVGVEYEGSQHSELDGIRLTKTLLEKVRRQLAASS